MTKCDLDSSFFLPRQLCKLAQPVIEKEIYIIFIQMTLQTWKRERRREREREKTVYQSGTTAVSQLGLNDCYPVTLSPSHLSFP